MSRAGKYPVKLSEGVTVAIADNALVVKGPKGELKLPLDTKNAGLVDIVIEEGQVVINPKDAEEKSSRTMWGTMARNVRNAVEGVSKGFEKPMYMKVQQQAICCCTSCSRNGLATSIADTRLSISIT